MSTTAIKLKKSSVSGKIPLVGDIDYGELALNYEDGKLYYKHSGNTIRSFLDSNQVLNLIDSDYLKNIINSTYLIATRPINVVEDSSPALGGNLNLNGHNITDSGSSGNITMSGNITGGNVTATGNVTGNILISTQSAGDEGGEVRLAIPQTNSTLAGSDVYIDIYQNKLRIFEQGGTNRGAFIDLTAAVDGVGTNLLTGGAGDPFDSGSALQVLDSAVTNGTGLFYSNGIVSITNTGAIAGTYGSASLVPVLTVNARGQIDSIGTVSVAGVSSTDWDSSTGNFVINTADGGSYYTKVTLDPYTTSNLLEGTNKYYTTSRADSDAKNAISGSTGISYNPATGVITSNDGQIVHDNLSGFVSNEHIDHSLISIIAGNGLTGGGDITSSRTISIDSNQIKGLFSAGTGVTYNSGVISIGQAIGTGDTPTFNGLSASSAKITSVATPTAETDAANKSYVDTIAAASIHYHDPVRLEGTVNLVATYDNGDSGDGATLTNADTQAALVLDGVAVDSDDRVLIYEQTNQTQNGIYVVTHKGSASSNWVLTRAADANSYAASSPTSLGKGDAFYIREGITGAGELYVMTTPGTITFGTTNITFSQISSAQIYKAGYGMELSGTTFSVDSDRVVLSVNSLKGNITSTNLLDAIKTVDGASSGLDADLLDGQHGSYYRINVYNSSGTLLN